MNRLQTELQRLYPPTSADASPGGLRALVLELARPADWEAVTAVWQGVQADLGLPAPAIAVNGRDGYQLWFSLAEAVPVAQARTFLAALCRRYLAGIDPGRIRRWPAEQAAAPAETIPARQADGEHWSAFVAPDLAPMFAEDPWLDMPPSPDGQADLLLRLTGIKPAAFAQALEQLAGAAVVPAPAATGGEAVLPAGEIRTPAESPGAGDDPRRFLLDVMNDRSVAMALRIEAAKALLPYC